MFPRVVPLLSVLALMAGGCDAKWSYVDADGDGVMPDGGDCDESDASIYPGAPDTWYDGIDSDCAGDNDYDADLDGYDGGPDGTDCDDNDASIHPDALDTWYDGVDQDCGGNSDYDFDGDGHDSADQLSTGTDCDDEDAEINPDATTDTWYDGVDTDCDGTCDYDQDGDGYIPLDYQDLADTSTGGNCEATDQGDAYEFGDCDDLDSGTFYDPTVEEEWYNGVDENCDDNDGDQDGDGYWHLDYETLVADAGGEPLEIPDGKEGDCWDADDQADDYAAQFGWDDLDADQVHPDAEDRWYDGIDQDCGGESVDEDLDQDGDGETPEYYGGTDCNDGGAVDPSGGIVDDADSGELSASAIRSGAVETWYDGVDQDCDDADDYDADGDGYQHEAFDGTDCYEATAYDSDTDPGGIGAADINPGEDETWYDGTDQDCDDWSDDDADKDGYDHESEGGTDCFEDTSKDTDSNPGGIDADDINPGEAETWYDGTDQDCGDESSDYDADEDGYDHEEEGGTDCYEGTSKDVDSNPGGVAADDIHPGASDAWYDGTDADCDDASDYDADADGQDSDSYGGEDCDDTNDEVYEGRSEDCDTLDDDDCDGSTNENGADNCSTFYFDADGDDFGTTANRCYCEGLGSYTAPESGDCDDADGAIHPMPPRSATMSTTTATTTSTTPTTASTRPPPTRTTLTTMATATATRAEDATYCDSSVASAADYVSNSSDCDDSSVLAYTGATEVCDDYDNDCDGDVDDADSDVDASGGDTYYLDDDGDSYGDPADSKMYCDATAADDDDYVSNSDDCDDTSALAYDGATEVCDSVDNDCNGDTDEADSGLSGGTTYYVDDDGDGYGDNDSGADYCSDPGSGYATVDGDCDDGSELAYDGAEEICDDYDNDCDGDVDEADDDLTGGTTYYFDNDGDGFGTDSSAAVFCDDPGGKYVTEGDDCRDSGSYAGTTFPGSAEIESSTDCMTDYDGDGYGSDDPASGVTAGSDCDDSSTDHTYASTDDESELLIDNDCDGYYDEDAVAAGDIYVTEFIAEPPGSTTQWIEIYNGSGREIDLTGWQFSFEDLTESEAFCIPDGELPIADGGYALLCAGATYDGTNACDYDWTADTSSSGFTGCNAGVEADLLFDGTDNDVIVTITAAGTDVDDINYGTVSTSGLGITASKSAMLSSAVVGTSGAASDNNDAGNWCETTTTYRTGPTGYGTPGSENDCTP